MLSVNQPILYAAMIGGHLHLLIFAGTKDEMQLHTGACQIAHINISARHFYYRRIDIYQ
jgi:hypothetical protein